MSEPTIKDVWAGMAMMALANRAFPEPVGDIIQDAWDIAEEMQWEKERREALAEPKRRAKK